MATTNNLVKVSQLQTSMQRVKSELNNLDGKNFGGVNIANGKINFFATSDTTKTPIASVDLPEEIYLDQTQTSFVQSFLFSQATYPGATNPTLDGKPVLVLAVKGDKTLNPTLTYSFLNLESLITAYTAADNAINIAGSSIGLNISTAQGNILSIANDGLLGTMQIGSASAGNFAIFGESGIIVDGDFGVATDADINSMLDSVFGTVSGGN